ncbi:MAG: ABC transporter permease [Chloroflexi bacterium]|nr:ABC transporter permease [Chloroflexota bacterium]MCI0575120.1 ABC transporter permease [Chloroflexota bacterium]MCI0646269.1 ABC transporter permease [Chloroflexota bacterium]MCI0728614.1 ABC transporter permease [Chloroflexota bacterium]
MLNLFLQELRARRGAIIGWGLGIGLFALYVVSLYPQFAPLLADFDISNIQLYQMLGNFSDMASFRGFISTEVFTFLPVLLIIYAVINGTGTLAGEEDNGTLEIIMALPIPRWQLVLTKIAALGLALFLILAIMAGSLVIGFNSLPADVDKGGVEVMDLVVASLGTWPIVFLFATFSLFLGAYLPTRRIAAWAATAIMIFSYFGNNLADLSKPMEALQPLFPFYYYDGGAMLAEGIAANDALVLLGAAVVFLALALWSFQRRNVTVAAWPWQRARI